VSASRRRWSRFDHGFGSGEAENLPMDTPLGMDTPTQTVDPECPLRVCPELASINNDTARVSMRDELQRRVRWLIIEAINMTDRSTLTN